MEYKIVLDFYLKPMTETVGEAENGTSFDKDQRKSLEKAQGNEIDDDSQHRNGSIGEPLSFSIPIDVNRFHSHLIDSFTNTGKKKFTKSELQNLCLQSRNSRIGIIELIETTTSV